MSWFYLIVAGFLETCWAMGLKYTDGFRKPVPSMLVALAIVGSMYFLAIAARTIPIGTAYAFWVGIGILGSAIVGVVVFKESISIVRAIFLGLLLIAVIGLKFTSGPQPGK